MKTFYSTISMLLLVSVHVVNGADSKAPNPWVPPEITTPAAQLPRLDQPLVIDGDLKEWGSAACVPVRYASYILKLTDLGFVDGE